MPATDEVSGVFSVIDSESVAHEPVEQEQVSDTAKAEGSESETADNSEVEAEAKAEEKESEVKDESGKSEEGQTETNTNTKEEPSKTETKEQEDFLDWKDTLPTPPPPYQGKVPEYDEDGLITNMTNQEYQNFIIGKATEAANFTNYNALVEQRSLDAAEKVLPEMKTDKNIRQLVQNVRLGSLVGENNLDNVQAAQLVRDALGLAPSKIAAAKTEGANNAKASVTIQKAAALETGSSQTKTTGEGEKITDLQKRIAKGDDLAFAELLGVLESRK